MLQKYVIPGEFEILALKLKLSKSNWKVIDLYKPLSLNDITLKLEIGKIL